MRQILKSLFLSAIAMICFTTAIQAQHYEAITTDEVFHSAATMPRFPGGTDGLMNYLSTHIRYPKAAQDNNIQGKVVIQFVVVVVLGMLCAKIYRVLILSDSSTPKLKTILKSLKAATGGTIHHHSGGWQKIRV